MARALPQTPMGAYTASPDLLAGWEGAAAAAPLPKNHIPASALILVLTHSLWPDLRALIHARTQFQCSILNYTNCRQEAATICPRPGLQVVTRYTSYTHLDPLITRCPCWPASTTNQSCLVTFAFDLLTLKVVSESRVMWATSVPILVFLGLSVLDLGPTYATDRRQTDIR